MTGAYFLLRWKVYIASVNRCLKKGRASARGGAENCFAVSLRFAEAAVQNFCREIRLAV